MRAFVELVFLYKPTHGFVVPVPVEIVYSNCNRWYKGNFEAEKRYTVVTMA